MRNGSPPGYVFSQSEMEAPSPRSCEVEGDNSGLMEGQQRGEQWLGTEEAGVGSLRRGNWPKIARSLRSRGMYARWARSHAAKIFRPFSHLRSQRGFKTYDAKWKPPCLHAKKH